MKTPSPLNLPPSPVMGAIAEPCFLDHPLFALENLYRAYRQCRRRKRGTRNALRFEQYLEANLIALREELCAGTYRPGPSVAFLVEKPKRREIFAADFRDRVVHHLLVGHLEPFWERRFIHDSYACRKGKGTHRGVDRLQGFLRQATANATRAAWYLQLDVRGFFIAIDRDILYGRLIERERDPAVRWLIGTVLQTDPTRNCRLRGHPRAAFEWLPDHKTLFHARPGRGLPIGNLTSQFFANVYLDALDQFVKHELKAKWYLRYCDDLVLLARDRECLATWHARIEAFLREKLHLELNERCRLRPVADGIDFLGYVVRPNYRLVRRRVVNALYARLGWAEGRLREAGMGEGQGGCFYPWPQPLIQRVGVWLTAYLAHFARANSRNLIERVWGRFGWLDEYYVLRAAKVEVRYPIPRCASGFVAQVSGLRRQFSGHWLLVQIGAYWSVEPGAGVGPMKHLPRRLHGSRLATVYEPLQRSGYAIAWIAETGKRMGTIAERALARRWETPHT